MKMILARKGPREMRKPQLVFSNARLPALVERLVAEKKDVLVLADEHNFPHVQDLAPSVLVTNNGHTHRINVRKKPFSTLIAVGGCTVIDVARACAGDQELIAIPTILSTACISVNKAVLEIDGKQKVVVTPPPHTTIVSLPVLLSTDSESLVKWSQSGFGDVLARLGAAIDRGHERSNLSLNSVRQMIPETVSALTWILSVFDGFNEKTLEVLAQLSHQASLLAMETGIAGGGEHDLYYAMIEQQKEYTRQRPTHGQIVAAGTLLEAKIFGELVGDPGLYLLLVEAYRKLQLPTRWEDLGKIGIKKPHLLQALETLTHKERTKTGILTANPVLAIRLLDETFSNLEV